MKTCKQISIKVTRARVAEGSALYQIAGRAIVSPDIVAGMVRAVIGDTDREHFLAIPVDAKHKPLGIELVALGSPDSCLVDPRSVFRAAIILGATGLAVAHNHPSGNTSPSEEDLDLTRRLERGAEVLGLTLLDHVIVTDDDFRSLREDGAISPP